MAKYFDQEGHTQQVDLSVDVYREAAQAGMSVEAYINSKHPVQQDSAPAFQQMLASEGIYLRNDEKNGIHASKLSDVLNGTTMGASISNVRDSVPQSRILFPAAVLSAIEDKLARDLSTAASAFDRLVAITDNIPGTDFKRVITHYGRPEQGVSRSVAQLAPPSVMLSMTVSERTNSVPSQGLGIEWSDQYAQNTSLDMIALSVARQVAVERDRRANENTLALLNGDEDLGQGALSPANRVYVNELDSGATTAGELTQRAWIKFLYRGALVGRSIDWIITDIDGALAIENRKGKPVVTGDDATSPRIDSQIRVANPLIPANVNVFVTANPDWPAGHILGVDSRFGIARVNALGADYNAVEQNVIRRANSMRWDAGSISYRLYDEAFSLLVLDTKP